MCVLLLYDYWGEVVGVECDLCDVFFYGVGWIFGYVFCVYWIIIFFVWSVFLMLLIVSVFVWNIFVVSIVFVLVLIVGVKFVV